MPMYEKPVVGASYEDLNEGGRTFEVVEFDENDGTIEIQYNDGSTDEIDLDDWYRMDLDRLESDEEDEDKGDLDKSDVTDDDTELDDDEELDDEEEE